MNLDYLYCLDKNLCIHRRGCKRWIGNYTDKEVHKLYTENRFVNEIDLKECVPNYKDINCENDFQHLDRFRLSDGSEMPDSKSNIVTFKERANKYHKCPKCKSIIIFIHGGGIEYDSELCSNRECDYEVEYETSTDISDDDNE